jgi:hypothetical protein
MYLILSYGNGGNKLFVFCIGMFLLRVCSIHIVNSPKLIRQNIQYVADIFENKRQDISSIFFLYCTNENCRVQKVSSSFPFNQNKCYGFEVEHSQNGV